MYNIYINTMHMCISMLYIIYKYLYVYICAHTYIYKVRHIFICLNVIKTWAPVPHYLKDKRDMMI